MNRLPKISQTRMSIKERLSLRKTLDVSANELELLELIGQCGGMSLQKMADELGLTKRGVDKSANRLIQQGHLLKVAGKLTLSQSCLSMLSVEQSSTKSQNVEQSYTTYTKQRSYDDTKNVEQSYTNAQNVEQSYTNAQNVEQSYTIQENVEQSTTDGVEQSYTVPKNVEQSATNSGDAPCAPTHGGSSILLNNFFETLKEEKKQEEKINPPNPLDKKEEPKKEEISEAFKNRVAGMGLNFLLSRKAKARKGKRLKRLPNRTAARAKRVRPAKVQPVVPTPADWSDELKEAFTEWLAYKAEKRSVYKPKGLEGLIKSINKHPPEAVIWAINEAIARNYQGFFPEAYGRNQPKANQAPKKSNNEIILNALKNSLEKDGNDLTEVIPDSIANLWR
jgi:hypothetical protein